MFSFSDSLGVITGLSIPANQQNEKAHGAKSINGLLLFQLLFKYICIFESVASFQDSSPSGVTQDVLNPSPNKLCLIVWNVANQESSLETQYLDFFFFLLRAYHMGIPAWHVPGFQTPRRNAEGCIIILSVKTVETQWTFHISQWWEFSWNPSSQMPMKGQPCQLSFLSISSQECYVNSFLHRHKSTHLKILEVTY